MSALHKTKKEKACFDELKSNNKMVVFTKEEINILKEKNAEYETINNIKLFKNIFGGVVVS
jgi:hypothetical protein